MTSKIRERREKLEDAIRKIEEEIRLITSNPTAHFESLVSEPEKLDLYQHSDGVRSSQLYAERLGKQKNYLSRILLLSQDPSSPRARLAPSQLNDVVDEAALFEIFLDRSYDLSDEESPPPRINLRPGREHLIKLSTSENDSAKIFNDYLFFLGELLYIYSMQRQRKALKKKSGRKLPVLLTDMLSDYHDSLRLQFAFLGERNPFREGLLEHFSSLDEPWDDFKDVPFDTARDARRLLDKEFSFSEENLYRFWPFLRGHHRFMLPCLTEDLDDVQLLFSRKDLTSLQHFLEETNLLGFLSQLYRPDHPEMKQFFDDPQKFIETHEEGDLEGELEIFSSLPNQEDSAPHPAKIIRVMRDVHIFVKDRFTQLRSVARELDVRRKNPSNRRKNHQDQLRTSQRDMSPFWGYEAIDDWLSRTIDYYHQVTFSRYGTPYQGVRETEFKVETNALRCVCDVTDSCLSKGGINTHAQLLYLLHPRTHLLHLDLITIGGSIGGGVKNILAEVTSRRLDEDDASAVKQGLLLDGCIAGKAADTLFSKETWMKENYRALLLLAHSLGYSALLLNTHHSPGQDSPHEFVRYVASQLENGSTELKIQRKGSQILVQGMRFSGDAPRYTHHVEVIGPEDYKSYLIEKYPQLKGKLHSDRLLYLDSFFQHESEQDEKVIGGQHQWTKGRGAICALEIDVQKEMRRMGLKTELGDYDGEDLPF
ncbi:MAG: hypothetical protein H6502_01720 [Candidatus Woesearchaeota archaeon]|nr:MAG: hypothetical protein H6502_01720 [Candidatus Woesearchaeota archaeon]